MLTLLFAMQSALAQIVITVAGDADVPLAVSTVSGDDSVHQTVVKDLAMSGYFDMQDPDAFLDNSNEIQPNTFNMEDWRTIGTAVLVKIAVGEQGSSECGGQNKICADAWIYHVASGDKLAGRRFRVAASPQTLGHAIANDVLLAVTGTKGVFGARLIAVRQNGKNKEIKVLDMDGGNTSPVTKNGSINLSPAISRDGRKLAWTSYKHGNPDLYIKDLKTGRTRVLSNGNGVNTSPAFSPSGNNIAIARTAGGDTDIFIVSQDGAEKARLTRGGGIDVSPAYSPDGSKIAWASEASGGSQIYLGSANGGGGKRVSFSGSFNIDPTISPDGTKLAYVSRLDGRFDIFVSDIDGRNVIRITQGMGDNEDPVWSPDGRYLLFSSTRTSGKNLWLSTADGRVQTQLTTSGGWSQPVWIP